MLELEQVNLPEGTPDAAFAVTYLDENCSWGQAA